jgi:hypothetical protein
LLTSSQKVLLQKTQAIISRERSEQEMIGGSLAPEHFWEVVSKKTPASLLIAETCG